MTIFHSATWAPDELTVVGQLRVYPEAVDGKPTSRLVFAVREEGGGPVPVNAERAIDLQEVRDLRKALDDFIESGGGR